MIEQGEGPDDPSEENSQVIYCKELLCVGLPKQVKCVTK